MAKLTGYVESDFLSAGVTSNNNESNSYSLRQRQVWGQAAFNNGFGVTAGQMWSLVTETRKGLDNRTEALPMNIDPQYNVGFSWARQYGFRVTKNFGNKFWLGASIENPQTLFSASGQSPELLAGFCGYQRRSLQSVVDLLRLTRPPTLCLKPRRNRASDTSKSLALSDDSATESIPMQPRHALGDGRVQLSPLPRGGRSERASFFLQQAPRYRRPFLRRGRNGTVRHHYAA